MDDQDRITDGADENKTPPAEQPAELEGVPIPSRIRIATNDVRERLQEDSGRDVVKEYEERYHGRRRLERLGFWAAGLHQKGACSGDQCGRQRRQKPGFALSPMRADAPRIHEVGLLLMRVNPRP